MKKQYVEKRGKDYWITGTRVSLDSVVFAFLDGLSPETIATECFPVLTLEQVYGSITYYLSHRKKVDAYLKKNDPEFDRLRKTVNEPAFSKRLAEARRQMQTSPS